MVVYGNDGRLEIENIPAALAGRQALCGAVGTLVRAANLMLNGAGTHFIINPLPTLDQALRNQYPNPGGPAPVVNTAPPDPVRFSNQPKFGFATAFVVAPHIIVSAGHAVWDDQAAPGDFEGGRLNSMKFVLGYWMNNGNPPAQIPVQQVYELDRMLWMTSQRFQQPGLPDFTVLTLDRNVIGVPILPFSPTPPPANSALWTAGFPRGLPMKYGIGQSSQTNLANNNLRVRHNITTFPGSSGSPIFNNANQVVGVHVRGPPDANFTNYWSVAGVISCPTYQAGHNNDTWAEGTRLDYVRWLFAPNARTVLEIAFKDTNDPGDFLPAALVVSVLVNYGRNQPQPAPIPLPPIVLGNDRQVQGEISGPLNAALMPAGLLPVEIRGFQFQLFGTQGGPTNSRRNLIRVGMTIGSNVPASEGIEYVNFSVATDQMVTHNRTASGIFERVIVDPIHF